MYRSVTLFGNGNAVRPYISSVDLELNYLLFRAEVRLTRLKWCAIF